MVEEDDDDSVSEWDLVMFVFYGNRDLSHRTLNTNIKLPDTSGSKGLLLYNS